MSLCITTYTLSLLLSQELRLVLIAIELVISANTARGALDADCVAITRMGRKQLVRGKTYLRNASTVTEITSRPRPTAHYSLGEKTYKL